jgi:hypothetical protein
MTIAAESNTKVWWQDYRHLLNGGFNSYLELESYATEFRIYHSLVVPGLLQTADYAKAIFRSCARGSGIRDRQAGPDAHAAAHADHAALLEVPTRIHSA